MYNTAVIYVEIGENEEGQRLDRFLRKFLGAAPLSFIYKAIRKDVKVNGKRASQELVLKLGDRVDLYISEEKLQELRGNKSGNSNFSGDDIDVNVGRSASKKEFTTVFEDENVIVVNKPFGLLTHGDGKEKKHHLANQVVDDLIMRGEFNPKESKGFTPAPANRLDRNTTGIVLFGKNAKALRDLNRRIRRRDGIKKFYLTIVAGELAETLTLGGALVKDEEKNRVTVVDSHAENEAMDGEREIITVAEPLAKAGGYTLVMVELVTGRSHQIRAHLNSAGYPLIGDPKYGDEKVNKKCRDDFGLLSQMLHAWKIEFSELEDSPLNYLAGETFKAKLPKRFLEIANSIFGEKTILEMLK